MSNHREGYETPEYRAWRYAIFTRDSWTCALCPRKGGDLEAHHVVRWADAPHLRYAVSNGICLCKDCHGTVTGREKDYEDQFKKIIGLKSIKRNAQTKAPTGGGGGGGKSYGRSRYKWRPRNPMLRF